MEPRMSLEVQPLVMKLRVNQLQMSDSQNQWTLPLGRLSRADFQSSRGCCPPPRPGPTICDDRAQLQ